MARFYVGQRVRLARPYNPRNAGLTGRIAEMYPEEVPAFDGIVNCAVDWDDGRRDTRYDEDGGYGTHTDQLEPILDTHQPCEQDFKLDLDRLLEREGVSA